MVLVVTSPAFSRQPRRPPSRHPLTDVAVHSPWKLTKNYLSLVASPTSPSLHRPSIKMTMEVSESFDAEINGI